MTVSLVREGWIHTWRRPVIRSTVALAAALGACLPENEARERFVVALLDRHRRLLGLHTLSIGCLTGVLVDVGGILRIAVLAGARFIAVAHNHCSGDPTPSGEDQAVTRDLIRCAELLGMKLLDHIVFGRGMRWLSVRETCDVRITRRGRSRSGAEW